MKRLLLILLIPLLALVLISCDQDMRSGIAGFLGTLGGNAYLDGGLVPPDHTNAAEAIGQIADLGKNAGTVTKGEEITAEALGFDGDFDFSIDVPEGVTSFLTSQDPGEQDKLKDNVETALGSDKEKQALVDELKKTADGEAQAAAAGTAQILGSILEELMGDDDDDDEDPPEEVIDLLKNLIPTVENEEELTNGDVLMLQLITDIVGNATGVLKDGVPEGGEGEGVDIDAVKPILNDVLFAAMVADELGDSMSLDFSSFASLSELITSFMSGEGK